MSESEAVDVQPAAAATVRWTPDRVRVRPSWAPPSLARAVARGVRCRCPTCGAAALFRGYLRVVERCPACDAPVGSARADDAPPYFTIFVVGHLIVAGMLTLERAYAPPLWVHTAIWLPLALVLSLLLLRPIKGATVGLMLKLELVKTDDEDGR